MDSLTVSAKGNVKIFNKHTNELILDKNNAIHPQNMSRIFSRALAHSTNSWIYRMAFGNGGRTTNAVGAIVLNPPHTGVNSGWASRLYNETFSEIVDAQSGLLGTDPGSADANSVRIGGGAIPASGSLQDSVTSQEVGTFSNVTVTVYINEGEPSGQLSNNTTTNTSQAENDFVFNEIGLYSPGLQPLATHGYSTVNVADRNSQTASNITGGAVLVLSCVVNGTPLSATITVPASGTGPLGQITYGDVCQGINSGSWITSGDPINNSLYVYITDYSNGVYPSILNQQSYGLLTFQSLTTGVSSSVTLNCNAGNTSDFFNVLSSGICSNTNFTVSLGTNAGSQNDSTNPAGEGERLLAHLTFDPITKRRNVALIVVYTLTISVAPTVSSQTNVLTNAT
jgi:hypothetical protein